MLSSASARASDFDTWSHQLIHDPDFKVRLSAGLRLGQLGDIRAAPVLTAALADRVGTVRTIAASALAKVVNEEVPAAERALAMKALTRQMTEDADRQARKAAKSAVAALEFIERVTRPRKIKNSVFVLVEPFADSTDTFDASTLRELTRAGRNALLAAEETFVVEWPGGKTPSARQLKRAKARAVVLLATITTMNVSERGKRAQVECKLNLILASYPQKAARTFVDGKAKLETNNRPKSVERAKARCAMDIVKHLMGARITRDVSTTAR